MATKNQRKFQVRVKQAKSREDLEKLAEKQPINFRKFFKNDIDVIADELYPAAQ